LYFIQRTLSSRSNLVLVYRPCELPLWRRWCIFSTWEKCQIGRASWPAEWLGQPIKSLLSDFSIAWRQSGRYSWACRASLCLEYTVFVAKLVKNGSLVGQEYLDAYPAAVNQQPETPKFPSTDIGTMRCTIGVPSGVKSSAMACLFFSNTLLARQANSKLCSN